MKKTWDEIHDIWNKYGVDEIFKEKYKIDCKNILEYVEKNIDGENEQVNDDNVYKTVYIDSVFSIYPSGKFYMPWTTNQNHRDVYKDEIFREVLEDMLSDNDLYLDDRGDSDGIYISKSICSLDDFEEIDKAKALSQFLETSICDLTDDGNNIYSYGRQEYMVVTDSEADDLWDKELDNYIEENVLNEIPENYRMYFDKDHYKRDSEVDGRGHLLSPYDGEENEEKVDGTWYYIYRMN